METSASFEARLAPSPYPAVFVMRFSFGCGRAAPWLKRTSGLRPGFGLESGEDRLNRRSPALHEPVDLVFANHQRRRKKKNVIAGAREYSPLLHRLAHAFSHLELPVKRRLLRPVRHKLQG